MASGPPETDILTELRTGGREALDRLMPVVYEELRAIAHRQLAARGGGGTLQTPARVHEASLKLVDQSRAEWQDRVGFLGLAALAMRHVLVDRARATAGNFEWSSVRAEAARTRCEPGLSMQGGGTRYWCCPERRSASR
jgi:hypothetical protein